MTDKERLEEAKLMAEMLRVETRLPHDFPFDLVDWLVDQAERVQELESELSKYETRINNLTFDLAVNRAQNQRYREAIEVAIHNMAASDNLGVKFALGILEQALGDEE